MSRSPRKHSTQCSNLRSLNSVSQGRWIHLTASQKTSKLAYLSPFARWIKGRLLYLPTTCIFELSLFLRLPDTCHGQSQYFLYRVCKTYIYIFFLNNEEYSCWWFEKKGTRWDIIVELFTVYIIWGMRVGTNAYGDRVALSRHKHSPRPVNLICCELLTL